MARGSLRCTMPRRGAIERPRSRRLTGVNAQNTVERRSLKVGFLLGHMRVIEEGLTLKDWVVVAGTQKAIPGHPVTPERHGPLPSPQPEGESVK